MQVNSLKNNPVSFSCPEGWLSPGSYKPEEVGSIPAGSSFAGGGVEFHDGDEVAVIPLVSRHNEARGEAVHEDTQ